MQPVTRFAPSPTGRLHLGHAYSALLAHDLARDQGGAFLLRIEDIDPGRSRPEHIDAIIRDLLWLGLQWDGEIVYQSERLPLYAEALEILKVGRLVYPCFCTRNEIAAEIAASAAAPHGPEGPAYPGTCRRLPEAERERLIEEKPHAWRLDVKAALRALAAPVECARQEERDAPAVPDPFRPLSWHDSNAGTVIARPALFGDVVIARKDAPASYHLAVTVDDAAQGVTDIVRGLDLFGSTHVHRLLQALLGLATPAYHHHRLLVDAEGRRLAKRHGAPALADLRAAGADPRDLVESLRRGQMPAGYSVSNG
jgi:glutamyl-Q tRNA(Asp) synthetase